MKHILLVFCLCLSGQVAQALTVFDPANYAQNLLIAARELQSIEQRIQQLSNEAQMLLNMDKNLQSLSSSLIGPLREKLTDLRNALDRAKDLARSIEDQDAHFRRLFPKTHDKALTRDTTLAEAKQRWNQRLEAFRTAFGLQAQVLVNVREDSSHLVDLMQKSKTAVGTKSAVQAGNELLALNVKQLLQLQALLATQGRGTTLVQAEQTDNQAAARAYFQNFLGRWGKQ